MKNNSLKSVVLAVLCSVLIISANNSTLSQTAQPKPELSIAGFRLGDEEAAKTVLQGYSPRYDNELSRPKYFFYNGYGNQVLSITTHSKERPFLIVTVEVFGIDESYQKKHFQMKKTNYFTSESGFFIGAQASAASLLFAIPNVTRPNEVIKKKGAPQTDEKSNKVRTLRYQSAAVEELEARESKLKDVNFGAYTAEYQFRKDRLIGLRIAVNTVVARQTD